MAETKTKAPEKVTVRVNDEIAARKYKSLRNSEGKEMKRGRVFHDPDREANPKPIGAEPIEVVRTTFVSQRIAKGDLVEVRK